MNRRNSKGNCQMKISKGVFRSSDNYADIHYTVWSDGEKPKAIVQLVHGMAEYIGRYDDFAKFLVKNGYVVYGCDNIGHGSSINKEEDLGYIAGKDGYINIVNDLSCLTNIAKDEYPGIPFILFGHSMGSLLARYYAGLYGDGLDGLILCGTSGSNPLASIGLLLIVVISAFKGRRFKSKFIDNMAFGQYNVRWKEKRTKFDWISLDSENVDRYIADRLCGYLFTVSAFGNLMRLLKAVTAKKWFMRIPDELPVLLVSGCEDPVGNYGVGVTETEEKLKLAGLRDVSKILYEGLRHEILNEKERETVYSDILSFTEKVLGNKKQA